LQQIEALLERLPQARWFVHEPVSRRNERRGCELALGRALVPIYDFTQAEVIVSLDGDFLDTMPGHLRYARDFAGGRRALHPPARVLRLHAIESAPTLTGAIADTRVPVPPSRIVAIAHALAETLGALPAGAPTRQSLPIAADTLAAIRADLSAHRGRSVIVPGPAQPPPVHLLAHVLNTALGNIGTTVCFIAPSEADAASSGSLEDLSAAIGSGSIDSLVALETNPAYTAPAGARFTERLRSLRFSVHCGRYADETAESCQWHAPAPHPFESWSDLRAYDGTATIVQPVLDPLFPTQSPHEILELLTTGAARDARAIVRESWQSRWQQQAGPHADVGFERRWHEALASGVVAGSASALESPTLADDWATHLPAVHTARGLELRFVPDPSVWDGAHANSAWLQELPRPLTSLVWSNALLIDPVLARDLAQGGPVLRNGDHVRIRHADHELTVPVWITPGAAPRTLTLALGYGRRRAGRVGSGLGFDAYALRPRENAWFVPDVEVLPVDGRTSLVTVQHHHDQHDRELAREMTVAQFRSGANARRSEVAAAAERSLYGEIDRHGEYAWGMTIDLSACIGCNACTIACQAENNIPAVGPEEVREGHEMHWIRVDRYRGRAGPDRDLFQPVPCMHCEKAPCEYVCPVEAAIHDSEGLNLQIYNRCIGTRDCSQNCPYKVRRFNWRDYNYDPDDPKTIPPAAVNPEVTVRSRGVMEKCTYCVQRISRARIDAKLEDRRIADAEVVPACAAVCPSRAISFGDLQDADAEVVRWRTSSRHYVLLEELGTRPRTTYLAALTNPLSQREPEAETGNTPAGRPRGERS
ncbi:MAG TPA: 4Fe-4S dicluster domain-containing protein, partial [Steroidobacteraceae bacterium]|nr:4Fe-4S dicluster domain-containing protein [Steroidobacteraceae bacterium]